MTMLEQCIEFAGPVWERCVRHPWIEALFAGELSEERFAYWLAQDLPHLGELTVTVAFPKVPPHNPWAGEGEERGVMAGAPGFVPGETARE